MYFPCGGLASVIYCLQFENKWHLYTEEKEPSEWNNTREVVLWQRRSQNEPRRNNQPHDKRLSVGIEMRHSVEDWSKHEMWRSIRKREYYFTTEIFSFSNSSWNCVFQIPNTFLMLVFFTRNPLTFARKEKKNSRATVFYHCLPTLVAIYLTNHHIS